ncbi:MAG: hypothetical protein ABW168_00470 [Sedimenticola sp.]
MSLKLATVAACCAAGIAVSPIMGSPVALQVTADSYYLGEYYNTDVLIAERSIQAHQPVTVTLHRRIISTSCTPYSSDDATVQITPRQVMHIPATDAPVRRAFTVNLANLAPGCFRLETDMRDLIGHHYPTPGLSFRIEADDE